MAGMHNMLLGIGGAIIDTQTVTAEYFDDSDNPKGSLEIVGYSAGLCGAISDGTSDIYGGAGVNTIDTVGAPGDPGLQFQVIGAVSNSGWSKLVITHTFSGAVTTWNRIDASYSVASDNGSTIWIWSSPTGPFLNATPGQNTYICRFYN